MQGIRKCHFDRLDLTVTGLGAVSVSEVKLLEDIERHERCDPLAIGRDLADFISSVIYTDRIDPDGLVNSKIFIAEVSAVFSALGIDLFGQFTRVKGFCVSLPDLLQRIRMIRQKYHFSRVIRPSQGRKSPEPCLETLPVKLFFLSLKIVFPNLGEVRSTGISVPGIAHGRRHSFG